MFTFKTAHATRPKNGSPVYDEISTEGKTFYKWSNDNGVYTELGGLLEGKQSYTIVFATDQAPDGRVLDNSRAFRGLPRSTQPGHGACDQELPPRTRGQRDQ